MSKTDSSSARTRFASARLARRFLFCAHDSDPSEDPPWDTAARWLPLWGLGIGILYAIVFGLAWRAFGEYQGIRWLPAAAVLIIDLAWCGHGLIVGAAHVAGGADPIQADSRPALNTPAVLAVVLLAIVKFALLVSLPIGTWQTPPSSHWGWQASLGKLHILCPRPIYRPLILMPFWGRWAMSLALSIGRIAPSGTRRIQRMAEGTSLAMIFGQWLLGTVLTMVYCSGSGEHLARGVVIALGVLVAAYVASFVLARRVNGQTEATVGATAVVTEVTFLALYVGFAKAIYWY